ncbi:MAG: MFS transporter [Acidimicrobiales bacterium]
MTSRLESPAAPVPRRRVPGMAVLPDRVHYGWWVAIGLAVVMFATVGVGYYGLAVFLDPLQQEHGWSNAAVSGATGLYFSVSGLTGLVVGPMVDRHGPIRFMTSGVLLLAAATTSLRWVDELWMLYLCYLVQAIAFGMAGNVCVNSIMARWFITKRAKAMSISSTGISLGGVVLSPVGTWMIGEGGIALAAPIMGLLVVTVALPIVTTVLVWDPAEVGLTPDAGRPDPAATGGVQDERVQRRIWTRGEAARTAAFWSILVSFLFVLLAQTGFVLHQIAFLTDRMGSANAAALTLSTTAMGSIIARFAVGMVADRLDKRHLTAGLFVVQALAVLGLLAVDSKVASVALVMVIGFTIGNVYMMQTLIVAELFGLVSMGTIYGVVALAGQVGSGLGPFTMGWMEDRSGSYSLPFTVGSVLTLAAAVIIELARPPKPPRDVPAPG